MKALYSRGAGIDNQHIASVIAHYAKDVGMATHEYIRPVTIYKLQCMSLIMPRKAADMGHQDTQSFALEELVNGIIVHQTALITVADNTDKRFECSNLSCRFVPSAEVSRMPYLVAAFQKIRELGVKAAVSI